MRGAHGVGAWCEIEPKESTLAPHLVVHVHSALFIHDLEARERALATRVAGTKTSGLLAEPTGNSSHCALTPRAQSKACPKIAVPQLLPALPFARRRVSDALAVHWTSTPVPTLRAAFSSVVVKRPVELTARSRARLSSADVATP